MAVPQPARDVWHRSRVQFYLAAKTAARIDARRLGALGQHDGDEYRNRAACRAADLAGWRRLVPAGAPPHYLYRASIGVWLFYVQHQFEETSWERDERWNFHATALYGSSHYDLPHVLRWRCEVCSLIRASLSPTALACVARPPTSQPYRERLHPSCRYRRARSPRSR